MKFIAGILVGFVAAWAIIARPIAPQLYVAGSATSPIEESLMDDAKYHVEQALFTMQNQGYALVCSSNAAISVSAGDSLTTWAVVRDAKNN